MAALLPTLCTCVCVWVTGSVKCFVLLKLETVVWMQFIFHLLLYQSIFFYFTQTVLKRGNDCQKDSYACDAILLVHIHRHTRALHSYAAMWTSPLTIVTLQIELWSSQAWLICCWPFSWFTQSPVHQSESFFHFLWNVNVVVWHCGEQRWENHFSSGNPVGVQQAQLLFSKGERRQEGERQTDRLTDWHSQYERRQVNM